MAESSPHDEHAEALQAMAEGQHEPETQEQEETRDETNREDTPPEDTYSLQEDSDAIDAPDDAVEIDIPRMAGRSDSPEKRAQRGQAQARKATHAQLNKLMFPISLVSGLVVLVLATVVVILKPDGSNMPLPPLAARIVTFSAFPLGLLLLVGAWWFHHESKQT
jgi:hypothetical protein